MKVLSSIIDPRVGGPQLRSLAVAKQLREYGVETEFLLPEGKDEFTQLARTEGFTVNRPGHARLRPPKAVVQNCRYVLRYPHAVRKIRKVIYDRSIDVVHANMPLNFDAAIGAWRSNAALVWHLNDILTPWPLNRIAGVAAERIADEIVIASESVEDHFFSKPNCETNTIYPPVDIQKFNPAKDFGTGLRDEFSLGKNCIIIGTVGNVNPIKGHEFLIRAAVNIDDETDEDVFIPIVGGILETRAEYHQRLEDLRAELDVIGIVQFLGHRSNIPQLLSQFDVFVLPSLSEACPMSVLEAMAMETPVVATEVGGVPEQIQDGESGWLVPSEDPRALADAVVEAIEEGKEAHRRAENARTRAVKTFSLDRCVERHLNVYLQVMDRST